jgi:hypothetical protein
VPDTVTKTKVLFSSECETKCFKAPFQCLRARGDCTSCNNGACGHSHVERYLYKRVEKTTCDSFKCVPSQAPCRHGASNCGPICASGACSGAIVGPPVSMTQGASAGTIMAVSGTRAPTR